MSKEPPAREENPVKRGKAQTGKEIAIRSRSARIFSFEHNKSKRALLLDVKLVSKKSRIESRRAADSCLSALRASFDSEKKK